MAVKFHIRETDVLRFLIEQLNKNSLFPLVEFSVADWLMNGENALIISRMALNDDRMDVVEKLDETTYTTTKKSFVPMNISSFNGEVTALNTVKEVVYETSVQFLVYVDKPDIQNAIMVAIEEVRSSLVQLETLFTASYYDLENKASKERVKEILKVLVTTGSLEYGSPERINGKTYMVVSMPITMLWTDKGEFGNQSQISLGTDTIALTDLEPLDWGWGTTITPEASQVMVDHEYTQNQNAMENKILPKSKTFSYSMNVQIDFRIPILRKIYIESKKPKLSNDVYTVKEVVRELDLNTGKYVVSEDLSMERKMYLIDAGPNTSISKGERIVFSLTFSPALDIQGV